MGLNTEAYTASLETEVLLGCIRGALNNSSLAASGEQLPIHRVDWQRLLYLADRHRVLPLLRQGLRRTLVNSPQSVQTYLDEFYNWNAKRNLGLQRHLLQVLALLARADLHAIPYKGPSLAVLAYGSVADRQFGDIDLLLKRGDYPKARHYLLESGFEIAAEYDWECALKHSLQGYTVDLHQSLTPLNFPVRLDLDAIRMRLVEAPSTAATIRMPCVEDMLLILCIQLAKDAWAHRYKAVQLAKLCDIAALTTRNPTLDWEKVLHQARAIGCSRMVLVSISVSRRILGAPSPDTPIFRCDNACNALVNDIAGKLTQDPQRNRYGALPQDRFYFMIRERWRDRLAPRYNNLTKKLPPNEMDHAFLPLPPQLSLLYWAVRPIRLLRDSARNGLRFLRSRRFMRRKKP